MWTNELKKVYDEVKIFCTGPTRAAKAGLKLLYRHDKPNETAKEGPLTFVLFESPFTSVSTVTRGHSSLVSLVSTAFVNLREKSYIDVSSTHLIVTKLSYESWFISTGS
jgi:hypothetical protein